VGTGWLGWTEEETLNTSLSGILLAYEGRLDMLDSIFGTGKSDKKSLVPATPQNIKKAMRSLMRGGRKK
jgi:hypothetical protein